MNVEITKLPESRVALKVELSPQEVEQALERTYRQLVQRVNIPGFRKGKAPRSVLERMVGQELFLHEATEEAIRWGYRKAVDQERITPIDEAEIGGQNGDVPHLEPGQIFRFEASVSVKPQLELPDYQSLRISREQREIGDADVDALVLDLRQRTATLEPTIRPAEIGDVVTMNVTGRAGGEEVVKAEDGDFELRDEEETGPDPVFPGLSKELVGANRGDIREIALPLPELYANQELAGKTMLLRILVKEIRRKVLPELNDEFAEQVSEFTTVEELREGLRRNLELEARLEGDERLVTQAIDEVANRTFVDIPPVLVEDELDRMLEDMRSAFERRQLSFQTYLETTGKSESEVRQELRDAATRNVKTSLVLGAVADAEHIDVSNAEIDSALEDLFRGTNTSASERRRLRSSATVRSNIRSRIRRQQAIRKLVAAMTGGDEVSTAAANAMADQTAAVAEDTQETVAVESGS